MMSGGSVRGIEHIHEEEPGRSRTSTWLLVVLGLGCAGFGFMALRPVGKSATLDKADPLAELAAKHKAEDPKNTRGAKAKELAAGEVTFPGLLSDGANPTTALAAVRRRGPSEEPAQPQAVAAPPPPTDRLRVVPLPAQNILGATPVVTRPRDNLTRAAREKSSVQDAEQAPSGREGGYQLQISSFRSKEEADAFSLELRGRGHKAYVIAAEVEGRGLWYRVRVGPFASQSEALAYRSGFESKERVVPFVVPPPKKKTELGKSAE